MAVARPVREQQQRACGRHRVRQERRGTPRTPGRSSAGPRSPARRACCPRCAASRSRSARNVSLRRVAASMRVHGGVAARERQQLSHERQRPGERVSRALLGRLDLRERAAPRRHDRSMRTRGAGSRRWEERGGARVRRAAPLEPGVRVVREAAAELVAAAATCRGPPRPTRNTTWPRPLRALAKRVAQRRRARARGPPAA